MSAPDSDFEHLLAEHQSAVRFYVRSLLPGYPGADDVAQEVMVTVWNKRADFEPGSNFKAWAFQISRYHVMNQRRKIARSKWLIFDDELMENLNPTAFVHAAEEINAEQEALAECLANLKPEDRELLHTRYATGTSLETYAQQEGIRPGTLKARLFRLRAALRTCIEQRLKSST